MDAATEAAIEALKAQLTDIYKDRLDQVILYGSHARGEATEDSDIDTMVVLDGEVEPYQEISRLADPVYDIELEHGVLFSLAPTSKRNYQQRRPPLLQKVQRDGSPI